MNTREQTIQHLIDLSAKSSKFTHFTPITRDPGGGITRHHPTRPVARREVLGAPRATQHFEVISVEEGLVLGWGEAEAIGMVQPYINGEPEGEPFLAFLIRAQPLKEIKS